MSFNGEWTNSGTAIWCNNTKEQKGANYRYENLVDFKCFMLSEKVNFKGLYTELFHIYNILKDRKLSWSQISVCQSLGLVKGFDN